VGGVNWGPLVLLNLGKFLAVCCRNHPVTKFEKDFIVLTQIYL